MTAEAALQPDAFRCERCGSERLRRSRSRGAKEQLLKKVSGVRAWRCQDCGQRQLSANGPEQSRRSAPPTTEPRVRRQKRTDPLAVKLKARRRKRTALTVVLVALTATAAAWLVIRSHRPDTEQIREIE